jgi:hypothetical protein
MSEAVLLLPSTDCLQQVKDYVRGCSTSTKYWLPSTSWRLCQRLFYFYQILTAFNKSKIMSEAVLLLPSTDCLQQVEDYVRGCSAHNNWKSLKTIFRYHTFKYLRGDSSLEKCASFKRLITVAVFIFPCYIKLLASIQRLF